MVRASGNAPEPGTYLLRLRSWDGSLLNYARVACRAEARNPKDDARLRTMCFDGAVIARCSATNENRRNVVDLHYMLESTHS